VRAHRPGQGIYVLESVTSFVEAVGHLGIAVLMFLEIPLPVIQSEIVMTFAGFTARTGELSLVWAIVAGVVGSQTGSLALYTACRRLPEHRVRGFVADHGTWLGFTRENLESAEERFRRHDAAAVLIGRLLPGLRGFIAVPAGLIGMPVSRFFAFNLVGTVFWVSVLALLGFALGSQYQLVDRYSSWVTVAFVGAVVALVLWRVGQVRRARDAR
jgi:membrane protein DedA with SNARE-associated domain